MNPGDELQKPIRLMAAACSNLGIGKDGRLPWNLPSVPKHAHYVCEEFASAVDLASHPPLSDLIETIWVVGGTQVYKEALEHPWCDLIYLTDIMADFDCDVFFPSFDRNVYRKQNKFTGVPDEIQEENGIKFQFQVFRKEI